MKTNLRLLFIDFWDSFDCKDNFISRILSQKFNLIFDDVNPTVVIYSCFGSEFLKYKTATRVFYTGENIRPNFLECDFAMGFDYDGYDGKNLRYPLYLGYAGEEDLLKRKVVDEIIVEKRKFCNMIVSNHRAKERIRFFKILNNMQSVDSGGAVLNNIGYKVADKMAFIKDYRFTIAFENASYPGYTTEKIFEPMRVNSIPIYWGNKFIHQEFNPKSFINVHDFSSLEQAAEEVIKIDQDKVLYKQMLSQCWFLQNELNQYFNADRLTDFFEKQVLCLPPFTKAEIRNRNIAAHGVVFYRNCARKLFGKIV